MFIQESGHAEQEKKNKRETPTNVYPLVQQITKITCTQNKNTQTYTQST